MRTLDRYVLREWARVFAVVMLGFPILAIVINVTDKLDHYLAAGLTQGKIALAYVFYMPEMMFLVLPAAVLFATVLTIGTLGRHSELTAAKASGHCMSILPRGATAFRTPWAMDSTAAAMTNA